MAMEVDLDARVHAGARHLRVFVRRAVVRLSLGDMAGIVAGTGGTSLATQSRRRQSSWRCSRITSLLPIVANDARFGWHRVAVALGSIFPFCALLGYLTPGLIDRYSRDDPQRAGKAYAINVIGCVLGPLVAGYLLLPAIGARFGLVVLAVPFIFLFRSLWTSPSLEQHAGACWLQRRRLRCSCCRRSVIIGYEDAPAGHARRDSSRSHRDGGVVRRRVEESSCS